jgi:proteasome component ECM29
VHSLHHKRIAGNNDSSSVGFDEAECKLRHENCLRAFLVPYQRANWKGYDSVSRKISQRLLFGTVGSKCNGEKVQRIRNWALNRYCKSKRISITTLETQKHWFFYLFQEQSILNLFKKLNEIYFEHQTNKSKAIALTIQSINKRHNETLKDYSSHILPLIFFAMHEEIDDENKSIVELWQELWTEIASGDSTIRLNFDVIVDNLEQNFNNSSWLLKVQSANSIKTLATRLSSQLTEEERKRLILLLLNNISGRTFKGKERLVQALGSLCKNWKIDESTDLHLKMVDAVMKECRKEEILYRTHCLKALGEILDELKIDRFEEVYQMVWHILDKQDMGDDDTPSTSSAAAAVPSHFAVVDEKNKQKTIFINLKETVCETFGKAWPENSVETQRKYQVMFVEKCVVGLENNTRPVQLSLLVALKRFLEKLHLLAVVTADTNKEKKAKVDKQTHDDAVVLEKICKLVLSAITNVSTIPHTGLKKESLDTLLILINRLKEQNDKHELAMVQKTFAEILTTLQKDNAPEIKCRLREIEGKLKQ